MSEGLSKIISIVLYSLIGISALLGILFYSGTIGSDALIYWCYTLFFVGAIAAIAFPVIHMAKNPAAAKSALIGVGALLVVFVLAYAMAGDEMTDKYSDFISNPAASKRVSTGLIAFYILAIGAVGVTIFSGISKTFK